MSEENRDQTTATPADKSSATPPPPDPNQSAPNGPTFTKGSDPLAGVKKGASDAMANMEGKTVSMKVYVASIAGVILLMLLARCGG